MLFGLVAVSAVLPSLLLILFFHKKDVNPEPARVLWATFGLGVLTIPFVLVVIYPIDALLHIDEIRDPHLGGLAKAFLHAAIPEELLKFCVVYFYAARHREFDEPMDGVVYGAVASLGFATLENVLYVSSGGLSTALLRAFTAVPGHAFAGALMGFYIGQAKFNPAKRTRLLALSLVVPIVLHGLYDFPLMAVDLYQQHAGKEAPMPASVGGLLPIALLALLTEIGLSLRAIRWLRKMQLASHATARGEHPVLMYAKPSGGLAVLGWLLTVVGGLIATAGTLVLAALGLMVLAVDKASDDTGTQIGMLVVGMLIMAAGFAMFFSGRKKLHRNLLASRGVPVSRR